MPWILWKQIDVMNVIDAMDGMDVMNALDAMDAMDVILVDAWMSWMSWMPAYRQICRLKSTTVLNKLRKNISRCAKKVKIKQLGFWNKPDFLLLPHQKALLQAVPNLILSGSSEEGLIESLTLN
jgi:hypothetical protein